MIINGCKIERGADLTGVDLRGVNLRGADLNGADLRWANLRWANITETDLSGADLTRANLYGANLHGTCLDPMTPPNGDAEEFETVDDGQWCVGYRTANSPWMHGPGYNVGGLYEAPVFSVSNTECHPGIFVCPTVESAKECGDEIIKVIFRPWECHHVGEKHRVTWLIVWDTVAY